ncbi:MAG: hypothetical protein R3C14_09540 [Caldilineaceae bacterium]
MLRIKFGALFLIFTILLSGCQPIIAEGSLVSPSAPATLTAKLETDFLFNIISLISSLIWKSRAILARFQSWAFATFITLKVAILEAKGCKARSLPAGKIGF